MFTLYYAPNTCTLASHIALVDAGAPYALKLVDFGKTEQRQAAPSRPMFVERPRVRRAGKTCQTVPGKIIDAAIADLLIEMMTPMTLAVTLEVQRELEARAAETDAARRQHVERMHYDAELARRRYMKLDPDNRLVADTLEAEWNDKLRRHADAAEDYERRSKQQAEALSAEARRRILDLAEQLPRIWQDPRVEAR